MRVTNNLGNAQVINDLKEESEALAAAAEFKTPDNHMIYIEDSASGDRLVRWDRERIVGENRWSEVDTDELEILGAIRQVYRGR